MAATQEFFQRLGGRAPVLEAGEGLVHHGPANLFRGIEGVGGWLWMTDRRLAFTPHKMNVQAQPEEWRFPEITRVEAVRTLWVIPNGLKVTLRDGRTRRFVVSGRRTWVDRLRERSPAAF